MLPKPRNNNALMISDGACNPSGMARTLVQACDECRQEGGVPSTDPAVRLIVSQLAYICGIWDGASEWAAGTFGEARQACGEQYPIQDRVNELNSWE
jgi:hypothetical protein